MIRRVDSGAPVAGMHKHARKVRRTMEGLARQSSVLLRLEPNFLILGGMKCGSTSLYDHLLEHPAVGGYRWKEVFFFDERYERGRRWYRSHFPTVAFRGRVLRRYGVEPRIGEATAQYLFHPLVPERVKAYNPSMKLIVLLRDPVNRAFSHFAHEIHMGRESLSFEEAIRCEGDRLRGVDAKLLQGDLGANYQLHHFAYLRKGLYLQHLRAWFECFDREQLLILKSEEFFARPAETMGVVYQFLDLPDWEQAEYLVKNSRRYEPMAPQTRRALADYYDEPNRQLHAFLGWENTWSTNLSSGSFLDEVGAT